MIILNGRKKEKMTNKQNGSMSDEVDDRSQGLFIIAIHCKKKKHEIVISKKRRQIYDMGYAMRDEYSPKPKPIDD